MKNNDKDKIIKVDFGEGKHPFYTDDTSGFEQHPQAIFLVGDDGNIGSACIHVLENYGAEIIPISMERARELCGIEPYISPIIKYEAPMLLDIPNNPSPLPKNDNTKFYDHYYKRGKNKKR